ITQSISNESNKEPMSDKEVGDCIAEIFSEGIDNEFLIIKRFFKPSNTLAFILYCIRNHLEVEQHILDEIEEVFGHRADFKITFEDLNKLVYIEAVIKEVLRVRPATATISCFLVHSDQIYKYRISSATQLVINIVGLHKSQKYWKEPMKFKPSRFLKNNNKDFEVYNKNAFMNF
ncbi:26008_t:CDS:2, partial [Gigaspora margarita]